MLMALGPFRFSVATQLMQSLTDRETARIASMDRAGAMPTKQFLGPGDRKIELRALIYQEVLSPGGPPQIELMRLAMRTGQRLPLVALAPAFYGFFLIEEIAVEGTHARPRRQLRPPRRHPHAHPPAQELRDRGHPALLTAPRKGGRRALERPPTRGQIETPRRPHDLHDRSHPSSGVASQSDSRPDG